MRDRSRSARSRSASTAGSWAGSRAVATATPWVARSPTRFCRPPTRRRSARSRSRSSGGGSAAWWRRSRCSTRAASASGPELDGGPLEPVRETRVRADRAQPLEILPRVGDEVEVELRDRLLHHAPHRLEARAHEAHQSYRSEVGGPYVAGVSAEQDLV